MQPRGFCGELLDTPSKSCYYNIQSNSAMIGKSMRHGSAKRGTATG